MFHKKRGIGAAAIIAVIAAALLILSQRSGWYLVVTDARTGQEAARYPLEAGDQFAVGFIHSVNLRPLVDVYQISDDHQMYAEETIYNQFGAGVQTQVNEGETMTIGSDNAIVVGSIHQLFEEFTCSVGVVSDRTLMLGDIHPEYDVLKDLIGVFPEDAVQQVGDVQVVSLSALVGREGLASFRYEYRWF